MIRTQLHPEQAERFIVIDLIKRFLTNQQSYVPQVDEKKPPIYCRRASWFDKTTLEREKCCSFLEEQTKIIFESNWFSDLDGSLVMKEMYENSLLLPLLFVLTPVQAINIRSEAPPNVVTACFSRSGEDPPSRLVQRIAFGQHEAARARPSGKSLPGLQN